MPRPIRNKLGTYLTVQEISVKDENVNYNTNNSTQEKKKHAVRLLTFIPGKTLYEVRPWTAKHFYQCGKHLGEIASALKVI